MCLDVVEGNGNGINKDTAFNITGKLVTKTDIQGTSVSCKKMWSLLHIPVHRASLSGASDICNKIEANSIGPKILDAKDYIDFYNEILKLSAYRTRCWHGSRMLAFIPYIKEPGKLYLMAQSLAWRRGQFGTR